MGKKTKGSNDLGRSLIKNRFGGARGRKFVADNSMLHTTEIQDGYDWGRLNLQSVTEESSFQEFLAIADLTGTEFEAEKLNIKFVNPKLNIGLLTEEETRKVKGVQDENKSQLKIPRRPPWTVDTSKEQLDINEKTAFLQWRKSLSELQEKEGILLTPYEKNLEFWRQLWRVVERSDVIIQIVDARNPLLFRCEDLEHYVKEVSPNKINLILINKADFLTDKQREAWAGYFTSINVRVVFYSALFATEPPSDEQEDKKEVDDEDDWQDVDEKKDSESSNEITRVLRESIEKLNMAVENTAQKLNAITSKIDSEKNFNSENHNSPDILSREQLTELFRRIHKGPKTTPNITTVGLVGYPNVGKSSTINSLLLAKKVSVSATPGKTKHFQTLFLDKDILLCDCPGLVMPSFVFTKAEMVVNGILPVDQMRDHVPPVNLIARQIPRHVIEDKYGIMLPLPMDGDDPERGPTSEEFLNSYAYNRGFMTANGQPDNPRASRYVIKDYINGKLLYCHAPPNMNQSDYHQWPKRQKERSSNATIPPRQERANKIRVTSSDLDKEFFQRAHKLGKSALNTARPTVEGSSKPWRSKDLAKRPKKIKGRIAYAHLDQH